MVAFDSDCLRQYWDVPVEDAGALEALDRTSGSSHSVRYDRLVELRVAARGAAPPELIVVERDGKKWTCALPDDPDALQKWPDVFRAFKRLGYDGLITVIESKWPEDRREYVARHCAETIRRFWDDA